MEPRGCNRRQQVANRPSREKREIKPNLAVSCEQLQEEPEAANMFFQLGSPRYERASLIVTSNKHSRPLG